MIIEWASACSIQAAQHFDTFMALSWWHKQPNCLSHSNALQKLTLSGSPYVAWCGRCPNISFWHTEAKNSLFHLILLQIRWFLRNMNNIMIEYEIVTFHELKIWNQQHLKSRCILNYFLDQFDKYEQIFIPVLSVFDKMRGDTTYKS